MAKTSERVMQMVRRELSKNPEIRSGALFEKARKLDRTVRSLSLRQFHALYPLQVKRVEKASAKRRSRAKPAGTRSRAKSTGTRSKRTSASARKATREAAPAEAPNRDAIRAVLLEFAGTVARAETKADLITVVGGLDDWVDRVAAVSS